jgi:hypothetical protein
MGANLMIHRQTELSHNEQPSGAQPEGFDPAHALHTKLWEQISRRLSGGARRLQIEVCHKSATVTLAGIVSSFYAKQVLYQLCGDCVPGFRVVDTTDVGSLLPRQD